MLLSLLVAAAASAGALPPPPQCSVADNSKDAWLHIPTPGLPGGHPLYSRFCGPARAVVQVHGKTFDIRGGSCRDIAGYETIGIGLLAFARAPTAAYLGYGSATAPTVFIQLPGIRDATGQAITTGSPIRAGAFVGHFRDGTLFRGNWTCN